MLGTNVTNKTYCSELHCIFLVPQIFPSIIINCRAIFTSNKLTEIEFKQIYFFCELSFRLGLLVCDDLAMYYVFFVFLVFNYNFIDAVILVLKGNTHKS